MIYAFLVLLVASNVTRTNSNFEWLGFWGAGHDPSTEDFILKSVSKERKYKHFDLPLPDDQREQTLDFGSEIKPHRFLPLLGFNDVTRRLVRVKDDAGNWLRDDDGEFVRKEKIKTRPIRFAGHEDAAYLQGYAAHLNGFYESALASDGSSGSVLA